jgi:3-dehydroquinate synthase
MKILEVKTAAEKYPIYIDDNYDALMQAFEKAGLTGRKICIVTDSNVAPVYLEDIKNRLGDNFLSVSSFTFDAGEESKHLGTISAMYEHFVAEQLDRKSVLVALGGGVVGDMTGFAAATYMRGIDFVQIPTTLLAQVDSSVGGKTGVDFMGNKNMVGAFYQPKFVYINTATLKTLPYNQVAAGLAEAVKYGYIIDAPFLDYFNANKESIKNLSAEEIGTVIYKSCAAKAYVVGEDEKENGLRAILNFGHTFGHAVETLSHFKLLHGECVAIGMVAALYFSVQRGTVTEADLKAAEDILTYFELPIGVSDYDADAVYKQMFYDKKTKNGKLNIVALEKIGKAYIESKATADEVRAAIEYVSGK